MYITLRPLVPFDSNPRNISHFDYLLDHQKYDVERRRV